MLSMSSSLSYARTIAQDPAIIDDWLNDVHTNEMHLIAENKLPDTGLQPFQILNFDEANAVRKASNVELSSAVTITTTTSCGGLTKHRSMQLTVVLRRERETFL